MTNPTTSESPLTRPQGEIFRFVYERARDTGTQPSVREIAARFGFGSINGVGCHLRALARKGWLDLSGGQSRAIRFLKRPDGRPFRGFVEKDE
jgi:repressor LexA